MNERIIAKLILEDGTEFSGYSFGFTEIQTAKLYLTPEWSGILKHLPIPSYRGQILVCTYPLIGNYGVPAKKE